jgi:hypothetical protein
MAKRAPLDEKPFRPLNAAVLSSVLQHVPKPAEPTTHVVDLPPIRPELTAPRTPHMEPARGLKRLDQEKRILFSREEAHAIDRLVQNLAVRLQAQVKASHVMRALTLLLLHAEGEVTRRAGQHGPMIRPPNGDMAGLELFERELARLLAPALRDATPLSEPL